MCPDKSILSAWFDNEIDLKWSGKISEHLESCRECHLYVKELQRQRDLLHSAPTPDFKDSLDKVKVRIREKRTISGSIRFWERKIPLPAAAAAAILVASVALGTTLLTSNRSNRLFMANENFQTQTVNLPGDKIDEMLRMMESSLSDDFSSNSIVELPANVNLVFNGDSQLIRSVGYNGSASP